MKKQKQLTPEQKATAEAAEFALLVIKALSTVTPKQIKAFKELVDWFEEEK